MDEFARNWNRPVHLWLQRHICTFELSHFTVKLTHTLDLESMETYKFSKINAVWITFLFSSILHEGFMMICFGMVSPQTKRIQVAGNIDFM